MWPWIHRIIAALLALVGSALAGLLVRPLRSATQALADAIAPGATIALLGAIGLLLLLLAVVVAAGAASPDRGHR